MRNNQNTITMRLSRVRARVEERRKQMLNLTKSPVVRPDIDWFHTGAILGICARLDKALLECLDCAREMDEQDQRAKERANIKSASLK